jgi:hypothetical protein
MNETNISKDVLRINMDAEFTAHHNGKFKLIREMDGVSRHQIVESLSLLNNRQAVFRAGQGSGKSGSFFFFSFDHKFIIKTVSNQEMKVLFTMLDNLLSHFMNTQNQSLLARIYGVYTLKSDEYSKVNIMIMQNTAHVSRSSSQKIQFDLKGSLAGRSTDCSRDIHKLWKEDKVLKDRNFIEINKNLGCNLVTVA